MYVCIHCQILSSKSVFTNKISFANLWSDLKQVRFFQHSPYSNDKLQTFFADIYCLRHTASDL